MSILRFAWFRIGAAFYFSATIFLSSLAIISQIQDSGIIEKRIVLIIGLSLLFCHFILYSVVLSIRNEKRFISVFSISSVVILLSILGVGLIFNVDYFRSSFHAVSALFLIFLYKRDLVFRNSKNENKNKERIRFLYNITLIISIAGLCWVFFYGYHGIILRSPGAGNWMIFNLYTTGIIFISVDALLYMKSSLFNQVKIGTDSFSINGNDFTMLLSIKDIEVLRCFVKNNNQQTNCSEITAALAENSSTPQPDCAVCIKEKYKATLCADYKRLYNQILKIKKILETMNIGTILSPKNKMNITSEGWVLRIFEDVRIHLQ